ATAGEDGTARLWELPSGALRKSCATRTGAARRPAHCLAFARDGRTLAVGRSAHTLKVSLWGPSRGTRQGWLPATRPGTTLPASPPKAPPAGAPAFLVHAVAFSPDGATLAAGGSAGVIRLWDISSGELRHRFSGHVGAVRRLAFAPDGRTLAS